MSSGLMPGYFHIKQYQDVDTAWHIIMVYNLSIFDWILTLPENTWRFSANPKSKDFMRNHYDLSDEAYIWLIMKWGFK